MGNCQAAEAATVLIHHPGPTNKVQRIYWSVSAFEVMSLNPGYYVAHLVSKPAAAAAPASRHLRLLRPDDTLRIGNVYRLISFEDVLKEFAAKKSARLGKLVREGGVTWVHTTRVEPSPSVDPNRNPKNIVGVRKQGHWRPALHSIAETGVN